MYKLQVSCLVILICISAVNALIRREKTRTHRWYVALSIVSMIQILFDIWSVYTVHHLDTVHPVLNRVVHYFFMAMMLTIFYFLYKYQIALIEEEISRKFKTNKWLIGLLIIAYIGLLVLPLEYRQTPKCNHSDGPAVYMLYVSVTVFLIVTSYNLCRHWKYLPDKKKMTISVSLFSVLCVSVYQALVPTALITSLGVALINMGVYVTSENPDAVLVELLKKETNRADAANQAKTTFLANMSHEIRTPINAVLGMNEMILRETKEKNTRQYAGDIQEAAKSLLGIINDILDITKIESGKLAIIQEEYSFCSLIHDVKNMIAYKANLKNLELKLLIDERIPSRLRGDDIRIRQILLNLINNGIKYTHSGGVSLRVNLMEESEGKAKLYFEVMDTGIGIKQEDMEKLFEPFQRIEERRNRNIEGTGLGLNITVNLLQLMGSRLEVESVYGMGSIFSFSLWQEIVDAVPVGDFEGRLIEEISTESHSTLFAAPEAKVLIVDDNAMNRKVFVSLLKETGIKITEASCGKECLSFVKQEHFDIIFLDHMMPEMDGIETLKVMQSIEDYPCKNVPVVMLTANAVVGAEEQYLAEGFRAFLSKPIDPAKLEELIVELLDDELVSMQVDKNRISVADEMRNLPIVEGMDWSYARTHFKDDESMLEMVQLFYEVIEKEIRELAEYFTNIQQEEQRKLFRIKVHSMKNSAATIGITILSGIAKLLEDGARDADVERIQILYPIFEERWLAYKELLREIAGKEQGNIPAEGHEKEIEKLLADIRMGAEQLDMDGIDDAVALLKQYKFQGKMEEKIEKIIAAAWDFDVEYLKHVAL